MVRLRTATGSVLRRFTGTLVILPLALAGLGCSTGERPAGPTAPTSVAASSTPTPKVTAAASREDAVDQVLAISVDGLSATTLRELGANELRRCTGC